MYLCSNRTVFIESWAIVVGIGVFVCTVHGRWTEVACQPRATVGDSRQDWWRLYRLYYIDYIYIYVAGTGRESSQINTRVHV